MKQITFTHMDRENHMTIIPVGETLGEAGNCGNNADHNFPMR